MAEDSPIKFNHFEENKTLERCIMNGQTAKCFKKDFPDIFPGLFLVGQQEEDLWKCLHDTALKRMSGINGGVHH